VPRWSDVDTDVLFSRQVDASARRHLASIK
jgi:hypothetical protein